MSDFDRIEGFDWDYANINKNWIAHGVSNFEAEQVFFNDPLVISEDERHSGTENRYIGLGRTDLERALVVIYTVRKNLIRVISARDMSRKERKIYEETKGDS